jgi:N-acetylneuraminic acid mutarotase
VKSLIPVIVVFALFYTGCANQNNNNTTPPTYKISGMVANLAAGNTRGLVLQNNATDNLSVMANGNFSFVTTIARGGAYNVTVLTQPSSPTQQCSVANSAGTAMTNITNIKVECGHNEWAWMSGSQTINQMGTYGTLGTPAAANTPSGRQFAATWVDSSGDFWLFGGYGKDSNGALLPINDLWKFSAGEWTWIAGPTVGGQSGNYGSPGVATPNGTPGARSEAASWKDAAGNFWLFGGLGYDSVGHEASLNDLWKYSAGEWTWVGGSALTNKNGVYGAPGVADPSNIPGARDQAAVWVDASGDVWLFGGMGYDASNTIVGELSDLWKYSNGQWTWMAGPNVINQKGVYGTLGTATASNVPGGRFAAAYWIDASGNLWLFGGCGYDSNGSSLILNDVWKYSGGQWTWMGGSKVGDQGPVYGTQGTASANNIPGARQFATAWSDSAGNGWVFGGNGYYGPSSVGELNDLWKFSGGQWTWVNGSNTGNQPSTFATAGTLDPANAPGGRDFTTSWMDVNGNLWLFGGFGQASGASGNLNDLWMYMP